MSRNRARKTTKIPAISEAEREQIRVLKRLERSDLLGVDAYGRTRVRKDMQAAIANLTEKNGVIRVREEDPLGLLLSKATITPDMYAAALEYRRDHENTQKGEVSGAAWTERVDGGTPNYDAPAHVLDSNRRVKDIKKRIGDLGYYVLEQVCGEQKSIRTLEKETEWPRVWISFTLKWVLEDVAISYGIMSSRKRTIRKPS